MTPVVSVFRRFRFGHAARATRTHRVSAPTHARIYTCVGASPLLGSLRRRRSIVIDTFSPLPFAPVSVKSRMHTAIDILRELRLGNFIPETGAFPRREKFHE